MLAVSIRYGNIAFFSVFSIVLRVGLPEDVHWLQICPPPDFPPAPPIYGHAKDSRAAEIARSYAKSIRVRFILYLTHGERCHESVSGMELLANSQYIRVTP